MRGAQIVVKLAKRPRPKVVGGFHLDHELLINDHIEALLTITIPLKNTVTHTS